MHTLPSRRLFIAAGGAPFVLFLIVYLVLPRHGFMIDDFAWVLQSRVRSLADLAGLFTHVHGFYRPLVALTFTVDDWLFGNAPFGYGLTNVVLALGCAAAIAALGRSLGLGRGASMLFGALWLLNFQGIRTAVLWVSGRSALLVVLGITMAARSVVRGRTVAALTWLAAALLAKEEAVLMPLVLLGWILLLRRNGRDDTTTPLTWAIGAASVTGAYVFARHGADAMTFASAPDYYRLTFTPRAVWRHAHIYADQVATFSTSITVCACLALGLPRPVLDRRTSLTVALGALWLIGAYGLTLFVPARSDLYACLPSVGICLAAATICERAWQHAAPRRRSLTLIAVLIGCVALSPLYYLRTLSRSRVMALADTALTDIVPIVASLPEGSTVIVYDDPGARSTNAPNLEDAFGSMLNEAYELKTRRRLEFQIDVPPVSHVDPPQAGTRLQLHDGAVTPVP